MRKIIFKNVTESSKQSYNKLLEFHKNKFGIKTVLSTAILAICILYMIISNIVYNNWKIIIIILFSIILVLMLKKYIFNNEKEIKENNKRIKRHAEYVYTFYKHYFNIKVGKESQSILYFRLFKVYETDEDFYLYTDKDHSLILSKKGFVIGKQENFSEFIKKKCFLKFKKEKNI